MPRALLRAALRRLALAGVAALGLAAGAAQAETVLRIATMGEPKTLDPHGVSGAWENYIVGDAFLGLLTEAADATPIPGAAESWTVSDDGLVYTFKLREHTWSDGMPVTAEDFVFSLRRILDPATGAEYASLLYPIKNAEQINTGAIADTGELGVRAIDPRTLEITLVGPTPFFLELLTHYTAFPVPRHVIEKHGSDWVKPGNFVGNGAYTVVEWTPNAQVVSVKNPAFYDAANVKIDKVVYYPDEDRGAVTKRFRAGEIDLQDEFASADVEFLKRELPAETRIFPKLGTYYYVFNQTRPPFDNPSLRRALSIAIDREAIMDKLIKTGELPAYGVAPPTTGGDWEPYRPDWADRAYADRVEEAKALVAAAGYGPDNPLQVEISYNTSEDHKRIAVAIQSMWKALGVQAELVNREIKVHYDTLRQRDFQVARAGWIADYNDPQNFLYLLETRSGPQNYGGYSNPEFDRLMVEQGQTSDRAERFAMMREAERIAIDDDAWAPIFYYVSRALVAQRLKGYEDNVKHIHRARWMSIED